LAVGVGRPEEVVPKLCGGFEALYLQQSVCKEENTEEIRVTKRLADCKLSRVWGGTLYLPEECGQSPDNTPTMFTSWKNKAEGRGTIRKPLEAPKKLPELPPLAEEHAGALKCLPTLQELGYSEDEARAAGEDDPRGVLAFEGGEQAALRRLKKWMFDDDKLKEYFEIRNGMLGDGYSSKLSPWLALGCISPRRIWQECQRYEAERVKNKSTYWLVFELEWRDFYVYLARTFGDKIFIPGGITGDKTPWRKSPETLQKWKEGRTGDQLVDANMRELASTGFMSNRGRQNVASYLIFDLGVDWRFGAAHFEEHLLDHDPCSNWGNWVAAAGLTGQRVNKFNTKKQLSDYDPQREYVRWWLQAGSGRAPAAAATGGGGAMEVDDDEEARKFRARGERFGGAEGGKDGGKGGYSGSGRVWAAGGSGGGGKGGRGKNGDPDSEQKRGRWRKVQDATVGA